MASTTSSLWQVMRCRFPRGRQVQLSVAAPDGGGRVIALAERVPLGTETRASTAGADPVVALPGMVRETDSVATNAYRSPV